MNEAIVRDYLVKLEAALGDDKAFIRLFEAMTGDPEVRQTEALGIVAGFVSPMAASTTKAAAFERILRRHKNIVGFDRKQRAVRGRSAA